MSEIIAVVDTETSYSNKLISVGIVAVDSVTFKICDEYYGIFDPAYKEPSMFSHVLRYTGVKVDNVASAKEIYADIHRFLEKNDVNKLFAYNGRFDYGHLTGLKEYQWFDIMRLAAYRQYNHKIPNNAECCSSGRLKSSYGVEPMYRLLSGDCNYREVHNALADARDEMRIMKMLGQSIQEYEIARIC